ncbi:restriction endonuclease subunit S [Escherichia coli]|uniref:restriction endonuclease subunit S n=1 Tax=Escherichia coli TaxID=562 RepID=UPI0009456B4E|nr:restriction endonuclease subunit S [Escherichia coli]EEV5847420.1 restriction endonuclease subunit S [Escherichia coli]EFE5133112.1 restriction endonuclease subunit S [Escherichia coli]EFL1096025.1 restriction endonuclease subunit S [Escherichia coli]EMB0494317.1 restriction endonuclease subunit S [Escherichia coli]MBW1532921.1 restriction endonuclease subunit S [Escherichia coli]
MSAGKLPEGWVETNLQNVASWGSGGTPSRNHDEYYNGNIPWIKTGDLGPKIITNASEYITDAGVKNSSAKFFPKGSVAIAMYGATIGKTSILGIDATTNQACAVGTPLEGVTSTLFLYYFLLNEKNAFIKKGKGGAQPNISQTVIKEHIIYLPPLAEQKIITEKLDTLLAQVESTKARLEQIPKILKRFRQAVLRAAMNGTLMGLKESRPHPLCKQWQWPEVPSTWSVLTYSELVDSRLGKMLDKVKNIGSPIKYLGNVNVRWFSFNLENLQEILISESERSELILKYGDILICEGGEPGRCAIWTESDKTPIVFQKALHRARVREKIIPEWLVLNLKNDSNNLTLSQLFTGTTIKHLTGKALAKYPLRVPPVYEQREIVRRVEQLFAYADTIEKQVNNALARVNNLTQSILAKAFRGELTAQWRAENPELISGENSAAALLEKIKAERAASGGKKASRKKS